MLAEHAAPGPRWTIMADPEGNEFCVGSHHGRISRSNISGDPRGARGAAPVRGSMICWTNRNRAAS
ncbi:MAG: hypothetical protein ACRDRP_10550 [Pseudonocardiaceae bacterium]